MISLDEIIQSITQEIDQTATSLSATDNKYTIRRTFVNRSLRDYGESYDWPGLLTEFNTQISNASISVANFATVTMPSNFRKLASYPIITWDGQTTDQFGQIDNTAIGQYDTNDLYVYFLYSYPTINMIVHSPSLVSGASVLVQYYRSPGSLASPVNVAAIADPSYLIQKAMYYEFKGAEDNRFIEADQKSELILRRMIENEVTRGEAYQGSRVKTWLETSRAFRIGFD